jgi:hypothetical protein
VKFHPDSRLESLGTDESNYSLREPSDLNFHVIAGIGNLEPATRTICEPGIQDRTMRQQDSKCGIGPRDVALTVMCSDGPIQTKQYYGRDSIERLRRALDERPRFEL